MCKVLLCIGYIPDSTEMIFVYICRYSVVAVADLEGGGLGGLTPPSEVFFFCLSVYENSHGPGP